MFARVTYVEGPADRLGDAEKNIRDVLIPAVSKLAGFKGGLWLNDRSSGKGLGVTLWESAQAMQASEAMGERLREESAVRLARPSTHVERYEVTALVGAQTAGDEGQFVRVTTLNGKPNPPEAELRRMSEQVVPAAQRLPGFTAGLWLHDRAAGKALSFGIFRDEAAIKASDEGAARIRAAAEAAGAGTLNAEVYELTAATGAPVSAPREG
jgi:heme-degrading monooxygenase HmoA